MTVRRLAPMLLAVGSVLVTALLMGFAEGDEGIPTFLVVPITLAALVLARSNTRGGDLELRWTARTTHGASPPAIGTVVATASTTAATQEQASRREVVAALGRFESRQWLYSPWFGAGVGMLLLEVWLFGWYWAGDIEGTWHDWLMVMPIMAHPMVGMAVIGTHHAATRGHRDGADELFDVCPVNESTRTLAHVRAGWVPAIAVAGFVVVVSVLVAIRAADMYGSIDARTVADILTAVVLTLAGSALGVALARWAPWRLVPIVAVIALVPVIVALGNIGDPHWSNARQLSSWPQYPTHPLLFTAPPLWWHLLWIAALGALMVWVALVHADRSRRMLSTGVAIALVVAGAGVAQTRPLSAAAASQLASMIAEPERHQTCSSAPGLTVCVYVGYEDFGDAALARLSREREIFGWEGSRTYRQLFDGDLDELGPEVAAVLDGRGVPFGDFYRLPIPRNDV